MNYVNPCFQVLDFSLTKVWHCFGNYMNEVDLQTVINMLNASKTNVIPINTHKMTNNNARNGLLIGFGGVKYDDLAKSMDLSEKLIMLNINHQTTAEDAIEKTLRAYDLTGEKLIKLEVLNEDMETSNNKELIKAVKKLRQLKPELILMPLLHCNYEDAEELVELGCPLLRVMGSGIGTGKGIIDKEEFKKICDLNVPVVLDGGVGSPKDFEEAVNLGAIGCLVNSMLFKSDYTPEEELKNFVIGCQNILHSYA
ncbi:MAG: thiazole biosynthesis family protein [Proteobacteria bacterium]|nr:thiazole biosynthesis family protein [Pseudomonadota bacterium]